MNKLISKIPINSKWRLALKILPLIILVILLKLTVHFLDYEFLSMSSLFTAIISANIFLIGFLVSGTLVDYKESEKLPGELSASLETMTDEGLIVYKNKKSKIAKNYLNKILAFSNSIINWFYKKETTENIMSQLRSFNDDFLALESQTQANFIARLKQEQSQIRKTIIRIHTIRDTSFIVTGYAIAEIITFILITGMIFIKIEPFYEGLFFVSFVSFILIYMINFIKDLDNPFGYDDKISTSDEVSLQPVLKTQKRIENYLKDYLRAS